MRFLQPMQSWESGLQSSVNSYKGKTIMSIDFFISGSAHVFFWKNEAPISPIFLSFTKYYVIFALLFFHVEEKTFWANKKSVLFFNWGIVVKLRVGFFIENISFLGHIFKNYWFNWALISLQFWNFGLIHSFGILNSVSLRFRCNPYLIHNVLVF